MDVRGKLISHQLLGVSGNSIVCESDSIPLHGQCLTTDLHQQERWCQVQMFHSSSKRVLGVVHGEGNCGISQAHSRLFEHNSRHMRNR